MSKCYFIEEITSTAFPISRKMGIGYLVMNRTMEFGVGPILEKVGELND